MKNKNLDFKKPESMDCKHCNEKNVNLSYYEDVLMKMVENQACFTCNFWLQKAESHKSNDRLFVNKETWDAYYADPNGSDRAGFKGFGGAKFEIIYEDGKTIECSNLWHDGTVPEHMRHLFHRFAKLNQPQVSLKKEDFA